MSRNIRALALAGVLVAAFAAFTITAGAKSASKGKSDKGISYVGDDGTCGKDICASGYTLDKLFGDISITYKIKATPNKVGSIDVLAKPVVMYTSTGAISGSATATLTLGAKSAATITNGKLNLTKGSGGQKGHTFIGTFTGTGNAGTGYYQFDYKGTYK